MSLKALSWAFETEVQSSTQKLVLLALCNFASETGKAYPTVETLCRITVAEHKAVRRALTALIDQSLITDTGKRTGATQQVRVYQLPDQACHSKIPQNGYLSTDEDSLSEPKDSHKTPERLPKDSHKVPQNGSLQKSQHNVDTSTCENDDLPNREPGTGNRTKSLKRFSIPTFPEMELYAAKIGLPPTEINAFFDHHEARGWKLGRGPMVSWEAAMRTWKKNWEEWGRKNSSNEKHVVNGRIMYQP